MGQDVAKYGGVFKVTEGFVDDFGADPVRWYMVSTSNPWLPTKFDLEGLKEVIRKYFDSFIILIEALMLLANMHTNFK